MKKRKFLNIEIEDAPLELELSVEQDVFLASLLGRLVELEAANAAHQVRKSKKGFIKRFFRTP